MSRTSQQKARQETRTHHSTAEAHQSDAFRMGTLTCKGSTIVNCLRMGTLTRSKLSEFRDDVILHCLNSGLDVFNACKRTM